MAMSALRWFKAALLLQILLLAYWLTIEVVSIFPWNDLASRPAEYSIRWAVVKNALQLLAYMGLFAFGVRPIAMLSVLGYGLYFGWQTWIWWKPYVLGADSAWQTYAQSFAHTLKLLPASGTHIPPDAQHIVLQVLALITLIATAMAVSRMRYL